MPFATQEILAIVVSASFAAGLNVYATVATLGLLGRFGILPLPASLHLLTNQWTIAAAAIVLAALAIIIMLARLIWRALAKIFRGAALQWRRLQSAPSN